MLRGVFKTMSMDTSGFWAGFSSGAFHALSGPDHLACLAPLAFGRSTVGASILGMLWGLGHGISSIVLCLAIILLHGSVDSINTLLRPVSNVLVGGMLLIIGVIGLREQDNEEQEDKVIDLEVCGAEQSANTTKPQCTHNARGTMAGILVAGVVYGFSPDTLFLVPPALAMERNICFIFFLGNLQGIINSLLSIK